MADARALKNIIRKAGKMFKRARRNTFGSPADAIKEMKKTRKQTQSFIKKLK